MSTPKQALADLEKNKPWPVYFLFGDEPFKVQEFVEKLTEIAFPGVSTSDPFCIDRIDGSSSTGADVLGAVQSMGLFSASAGKRLVIVRQAHQLKEVDLLANALMENDEASPWGDSLLVLIADSLDGRRKFHQWLKKKGFALEFKVAKDAELLQWVQYLIKKRQLKVSSPVAELLAIASDGSLYRLSQEIEKAWIYAGAKAGIELTAEHVNAVSSTQITHEMIELVRAVVEGKRTRSLLLTEKLIRAPEDAMGFVGFLTWSLKNPNSPEFTRAAQSRDLRILRPKMLESLIELDSRLKGSGVEATLLVEQFVIENTGELGA